MNKWIFSSLLSALTYKGYHESSKIVYDNVKISFIKMDPIKFAMILLKKFLQSKASNIKINLIKKYIRFDEHSNHPTLIQVCFEKGHDVITSDHSFKICNNFIFNYQKNESDFEK